MDQRVSASTSPPALEPKAFVSTPQTATVSPSLIEILEPVSSPLNECLIMNLVMHPEPLTKINLQQR